MAAAALMLVAIIAAIAPSIGSQLNDLGTGVQDGIQKLGRVLADPPFNLSRQEVSDRIQQGIDRLRHNSGPITHGVQTGAILLGEVVTGLIITLLLTFFFLKDGAEMWRWSAGSSARGASAGTRWARASTSRSAATCAASRWSAWSTRC